MITYCSISDVKSMKLHSIGIEIFTTEYCLRQPNYVLVSRHLNNHFHYNAEFLPYIQLDNTPGVTRNSLFGDDACSGAINIPVGFHFGDLQHTAAYVRIHSTLLF